MKKNLFFPNLDGLRFFCFLSVFLFHSFYTVNPDVQASPAYNFINNILFANGNLGVNFFFVLSGFLITYLLLEEKELNGKIDVPKFWLRRILRIWPLYYFAVFFGFVIFPLIKHFFNQPTNETASLLSYLTFTGNFDFIIKGLPDCSVLGVLWSIAIEEQFYLIWPIVLSLVPFKRLWIPFTLIIAGSLVFRETHFTFRNLEHHTLSCMNDLAVGALGAWLCIASARFKAAITAMPKFVIGIIYLSLAAVFFFRQQLFFEHHFSYLIDRLVIAIIMLLVILEQNYATNSFFKLSRLKRISNLGTISYGLYCLHFIGILITIQITDRLHLNDNIAEIVIIQTTLSFAFTILISKLSYRYLESPFLKLKNRFAYIVK